MARLFLWTRHKMHIQLCMTKYKASLPLYMFGSSPASHAQCTMPADAKRVMCVGHAHFSVRLPPVAMAESRPMKRHMPGETCRIAFM